MSIGKRTWIALFLLLGSMLFSASMPIVSAQSADAGNENTDELIVIFATVAATNKNVGAIPEAIEKTAIVHGTVKFAIATNGRLPKGIGISPQFIIGFMKDQSKGPVPGNIVRNPYFLQYVWKIASENYDENLHKSIVDSEAKASILIDLRCTDPMGSIEDILPDIIGTYLLDEQGKIEFEPNVNYSILTENGFIRLTPFIVKAMFNKNK